MWFLFFFIFIYDSFSVFRFDNNIIKTHGREIWLGCGDFILIIVVFFPSCGGRCCDAVVGVAIHRER